MMTYHYFGKEQKVLYEKLDNGFEVYILPNKNINKFHIEIVTKYGSEIEKVKLLDSDEYLNIPSGTAHFLEHKIFDMEEEDAISHFAKYGLYTNAGTNYFSTRYYVDGNKNFKEALDYLLKMVYTPYISDETVNKEMGIIEEEIKMYDDEAIWILDDGLREALFQNILQKKIAGTVSSIHEITSDILNKVYNIFYQPSNMFMVVSGNVSPKKILDIIKNNREINRHITKKEIIYKEKKEFREVQEEYKEIRWNVCIPKLRYAFKLDLNDFNYPDKRLLRYYLDIIFTVLFGDSSSFDETVIERNIVSYFYLDHFKNKNIYTFDLEAESEYADLFKDEVDKTLKNINITEEDFLRAKKVWISLMIRSLDNIEALANAVINDILLYDTYQDEKDYLDKLNYQELIKIVKEININNNSFVLMLPKE